MLQGLEVVHKMEKFGLAAAYFHRQLKKIYEDLKDIVSVTVKNSFPTLRAWDLSASEGTGMPKHSPSATSSGRSVRERQFQSRSPTGGRKTTIYSKCSSLGQPADYSFKVCPNMECYMYRQKGHIAKNVQTEQKEWSKIDKIGSQ